MIILELEYNQAIEKGELKKLISFISIHIIKFEILKDTIKLMLEDLADINKVKENYNKLVLKYCSTKDKEECIYKNYPQKEINFTQFNEIYDSGWVKKYGDGLIGLNETSLELFDFFSHEFRRIALEEEAEERMYPTLLDIKAYQKTGYLKSSPQYATFCCDVLEDVDSINQLSEQVNGCECKKVLGEPKLALSPSACFHTYLEFENHTLASDKTVTFMQKVFRNEGRFNWDEFGRLRDYHVREIVFIGGEEYVMGKRQSVMDQTKVLLENLSLGSEIASSSDPFITPDMQRYKNLQIYEKNKYETRILVEADKSIACASFNVHGVSFTKPFQIRIDHLENTVTGCIGFGIERWVLAFLSQYGLKKENWPIMVQEFMKNRRN